MPCSFFTTSIITLLALALLRPTGAITCHPSPTILPLPLDCRELATALIESSRLPSYSIPKAWGRDLPSTDLTEHLPKLYWIRARGSRGSTTCGLQLDVDAREPWAVEMFGLSDVGAAAAEILESCLVREHMVGVERLGPGKRVHARLVRIDRGVLGVGSVQMVAEAGLGRVLLSSGRNGTGVGIS